MCTHSFRAKQYCRDSVITPLPFSSFVFYIASQKFSSEKLIRWMLLLDIYFKIVSFGIGGGRKLSDIID